MLHFVRFDNYSPRTPAKTYLNHESTLDEVMAMAAGMLEHFTKVYLREVAISILFST